MCASVCGGSAESGMIFVLLFCIPLATFLLIGLFNCMFRGGCNGNEGKTYVNKRAIDRRLERASNGFYVGDLDRNPPEESISIIDEYHVSKGGAEYRVEKNETKIKGANEFVCMMSAPFMDDLNERIKKRAVMLSTLKDIESGKVDPNEIIGNRERVLVLARKSS